MAPLYKRTIEIADAFAKYLESRDLSLIEQFTREEIEIALLQLIEEGDSPYYAAMKIRREELKKIEDQEIEKWEKWKHRITLFVVGVILGFVLLFLKLIYFS
jgi:hypothetical protein